MYYYYQNTTNIIIILGFETKFKLTVLNQKFRPFVCQTMLNVLFGFFFLIDSYISQVDLKIILIGGGGVNNQRKYKELYLYESSL